MMHTGIDYQGGVSHAFDAVANTVPKLAAFVVILFVGWIVGKVLARIAARVLKAVGFNRLVLRAGGHRLIEGGTDPAKLTGRVVYYAVLLMALEAAFGVFGPNPVETLLSGVIAWLPRGLVAAVLVVIAAAVANTLRGLISAALGAAAYGSVLARAAWAFVLFLGVTAAAGQAGIGVSVTEPVLDAVLAALAGIAVVGFGGGLVVPMSKRWESFLAANCDRALTGDGGEQG